MASSKEGAPPACCPPGSWPAAAAPIVTGPALRPSAVEGNASPPYLTHHKEYAPKGTEEMVGDLPVYYAGTPGPRVVIVLGEPNNWGGRTKGIVDTLAGEGFFAVTPDSFRKDNGSGAKDMMGWIKEKGNFEQVVGPDMRSVVSWLEKKGCPSVAAGLNVGAIGFCWGVWALIKASGDGLPLKCGVGPHPSHRLESVAHGMDETVMLQKLSMPVFLMPAGNDRDIDKPGGENAKLIEAKGGKCELYPDMQHGWMVRGDLKDQKVLRDAESCMAKSIAYLKQHLSDGSTAKM